MQLLRKLMKMPNYNIMKDLYGIWNDSQEDVEEDEIYIEDEEA